MTDRSTARLRLSSLPPGKAHDIALRPGAETRARIAGRLGLDALRKLSFTGSLIPIDRQDWQLRATLGATVVQPCVVTLAPVTTRIEAEVVRTYLRDMPAIPEGEEIEMPEDDTLEPLPDTLDLEAVMEEALALNLPLYPHAEGAAPGDAVFAEPGVTPMRDEDAKPFAGLAGLKKRLEKDGGETGDE